MHAIERKKVTTMQRAKNRTKVLIDELHQTGDQMQTILNFQDGTRQRYLERLKAMHKREYEARWKRIEK